MEARSIAGAPIGGSGKAGTGPCSESSSNLYPHWCPFSWRPASTLLLLSWFFFAAHQHLLPLGDSAAQKVRKTYECDKSYKKWVQNGCTYDCDKTTYEKCYKEKDVYYKCDKKRTVSCKKYYHDQCTRRVPKTCYGGSRQESYSCTKYYDKEVKCGYNSYKKCKETIAYPSTCTRTVGGGSYDCSYDEKYSCKKSYDGTCEETYQADCKKTEKYETTCPVTRWVRNGCSKDCEKTITYKGECEYYDDVTATRKVTKYVKGGCSKDVFKDKTCYRDEYDAKCCARHEDKKSCPDKYCTKRECY